MAGLDKIISQIKEESQKAAERTRAEARSKADEILAQARADAERECVDIERRSKQAVANILERVIGATIGMAKAELKGLETGAYIDMILKLAVKSAQTGEGELLFSKKDLERLPEGFEDRLNAALKDKGAVLRISGDTRDIDGGFVLTYGGIEENCSIDALFDAAHEVLQDKVQEILFS